MSNPPDAELVVQARAGDRPAFDQLVHRYQPLAERVARKMVADADIARDLAQEALLQAYLSLAHLREDCRFESWLRGIVQNVCRSHLRARKAEWLSLETLTGGIQLDLAHVGDASVDPERAALEGEQALVIRDALQCLAPDDRQVTHLFYERQLSLREIAARTGSSVAAVKNRLYRGRKQLRAQLVAVDPEMGALGAWERRSGMIKVSVSGVFEEEQLQGRGAAVVLVDEAGRRALRIAMSPVDAAAIDLGLRQPSLPRPMTYHFIAEMLAATGAKLDEVRIETLQGGVFYAVAKLRRGKTVRELDARPSDALALAVHTGTPIYVAEGIMGQAGLDLPEPLEKSARKPVVQALTEAGPIPDRLPISPLRDGVYFPGTIAPLFMGREKTIRALEEAQAGDRYLLLLTQKDFHIDDPQPADVYTVGTVARLMDVLRLPDGTARVMIESKARARVGEYLQTEPFHCARVELIPEAEDPSGQEALLEPVLTRYRELVQQGKLAASAPALSSLQGLSPGRIADTLAPFLSVSVAAKQEILETADPLERLEKLRACLQ